MEHEMNVLEQLESREFAKPGCFGFYDWFCNDKSLPARSERLTGKLRRVLQFNVGKFDPTKVYVFFKNNCPLYGKLYDDFRICDLETGDVLFTITPAMGYDNQYGKASLWGHPDGKTTSEFVEDILIWFGKKDDRAEKIAAKEEHEKVLEQLAKREFITKRIITLRQQLAEAETQLVNSFEPSHLPLIP
jgi:hypothetical protein